MKQSKHKWLITYDDSKYIRELFSFANIKSWNLTYGMRNVTENSNQLGKELFIANYEIELNEYQQLSFFNSNNLDLLSSNHVINSIKNTGHVY